MATKRATQPRSERNAYTGPERRLRWGRSVFILLIFDLMAFGAAVWLTLAVPEVLDIAAMSANASSFDNAAQAKTNGGRGGS